MKFIDISFEDYSNLRNELNEFVMLAKSRDYTPSKDEFDDIIKFILLYQNGGATLCESYNNQDLTSQKLTNQLYESFHLNEDEKDFDSAVGTATTVVKGAAVGAAGAAIGIGALISFLFKRNKIKKSVEKEFAPEFERLNNYKTINKLKAELHKLEGGEGEFKAELPGLISGGGKPEAAKSEPKGGTATPEPKPEGGTGPKGGTAEGGTGPKGGTAEGGTGPEGGTAEGGTDKGATGATGATGPK